MRLYVYVCIITQLLTCEQISTSFSKRSTICLKTVSSYMDYERKSRENKWAIVELFMH